MKNRLNRIKGELIVFLLFLGLLTSQAQYNLDAPWMQQFSSEETFKATSEQTKFKDVVDAFDTYWENKDYSKKGSGYKPFKRWEEYHKNSLLPDGTLPTPEFLWNIWKEKQAMYAAQQKNTNTWAPMGPFDHNPDNSWSPGQGRVNVGIVDPNNSHIMYIGAPAGGIWKSIDNGEHWEPLSDYLPQIGVSGIAIDPNDSDVIYISTGDDDSRDAYGIGVLKSIDGGVTWSKTGLVFSGQYDTGNDIYIDPNNSNTLWVATTKGVYKTMDAGENWIQTLGGNIKDIKLKPGDANVVYAVTSNAFYKSTNGGDSFFRVYNGLPNISNRLAIDVSPANSDYVYVLSAGSGYSFQGLYKSTNSADSFLKTQETTNIFESTQAWYDMALAVSDQDADTVFVGCLNIWKSTDGGDGFLKINNWSSPRQATYTHADIHFLRYYNGKLLCGSDGGIYVSETNGDAFTDLTKGLQIGQFYKISVSENNSSDYLVGGLQDNGGYALNESQWNVYYGADGMDCAVKGNNDDTYYGFIQNGRTLYETRDRGESRRYVSSGPERGNWVTPLVSDRNGTLYAGYSSFYKLEGFSFVDQTSFDFGIGNIDHIELDPSDINTLYVANGFDLYRSLDKGVNWSKVFSFSTSITSIEVDNDNSDIVYVTVAGSSNKTVFKSDDKGNNFINISENLPSEGKFVVKHHKGTSFIYVGTYLGVYYKDGDQPWQEYSANLPNVAVRDLEINLGDNVLIAATYGRGVWKIPLVISNVFDDQVPSQPKGLMVSDVTQTSCVLSWVPSTDNIGVTRYEIYQGTDFIKSVMGTLVNVNGLMANTSYNFRVIAKDNAGNQSEFSDSLEVLTTDENQSVPPFTINFYKPYDWSTNVNVYFFDQASDTTLPGTKVWPGESMSNFSGTNWYAYTLTPPAGVSASDIKVIFNDGNSQTGDLSRSIDGWYYEGLWSNECPVDCEGTGPSILDFYFLKPSVNWGDLTNIYVFNSKENRTLSGTADWPGSRMVTFSGSPWGKTSVVIPDGVSADDIGIVFNNGGIAQTIDLSRDRTGWFTTTYVNGNGKVEGHWSDSCPSSCLSRVLGEVEKGVSTISITPNPIDGKSKLQLYTSEKGILEILAIDMLGQQKQIYVQDVMIGDQEIELRASDMNKSGIYFYSIRLNGKRLNTLKVIIQ